jgi:hypothetical protein
MPVTDLVIRVISSRHIVEATILGIGALGYAAFPHILTLLDHKIYPREIMDNIRSWWNGKISRNNLGPTPDGLTPILNQEHLPFLHQEMIGRDFSADPKPTPILIASKMAQIKENTQSQPTPERTVKLRMIPSLRD